MSETGEHLHRIRPFRSLEDYQACVELQEETWGEGFSERVSVAILKVSQRLGGVAAGAYDPDGRLVGFVFGMTGLEDGTPVHWSDMLAVRPELRNSGLGTRLKRYQRERLLERGIRRMYWTFDPLESRNAYLNFGKLGIVVREYVRNMYGETDSPLHRGIGTDRFVALWLMASARVRDRLEGDTRPPGFPDVEDLPRALEVDLDGGHPVPRRVGIPEGERILVPIPRDLQLLKNERLEWAVAWREATREVFTELLSGGFEVTELIPGEDVSHYLLVRRHEP